MINQGVNPSIEIDHRHAVHSGNITDTPMHRPHVHGTEAYDMQEIADRLREFRIHADMVRRSLHPRYIMPSWNMELMPCSR